jgi:hypothetical protein
MKFGLFVRVGVPRFGGWGLRTNVTAFRVECASTTNTRRKIKKDQVRIWKANRLTDGWVIRSVTRFSIGLPLGMEEYDDHSRLGTTSASGVGVLE